jgi:hypothetical protein
VVVDTGSTGHAFFAEPTGLYEAFFSPPNWLEQNRVPLGNGTGQDPTLWSDNAVWIAWTNNGMAHISGFFNIAIPGSGGDSLLGSPWSVFAPKCQPFKPCHNWLPQWQSGWDPTVGPPDSNGFFVESGFGWNNGPTGRLNLFGQTLPARDQVDCCPEPANNGIRERYWDGSGWHWTDHGRPPGTDTVALGRNSAVWDHVSQQGRVFVAAGNTSDARSIPQLWDRFWDGNQWTWEPLGNPYGTTVAGNDRMVFMQAPVAVDGVLNGNYYLQVFVAGLRVINAQSIPQYRFELYLIQKDPLQGWSPWYKLLNPDNAPFTTDINSAGASFFTIDQGVRWFDGSVLRGALFGSDTSGQLIRWFLDLNTWSWHWDTPSALPSGVIGSRVSSAVVTDASGWHLTALMRDNNGTIWNREYDNSDTGTWAQSWQ